MGNHDGQIYVFADSVSDAAPSVGYTQQHYSVRRQRSACALQHTQLGLVVQIVDHIQNDHRVDTAEVGLRDVAHLELRAAA